MNFTAIQKAKACKKNLLGCQIIVRPGVPFYEFSNQLLTASAKFEKLKDSPSVRKASSSDRYFPVLTRQPCNENNGVGGFSVTRFDYNGA